ncbi:hypothetical protein MHU86_9972 [Fragilaria crotonensis]|nr:hypothetical protein MHU86_9972 [Fragilaria crotonensis]
MTTTEAMTLFEKHDSYIKSLRFIQLSPMINNLDTVRTEFFPDGTQMERTTRDWAASIVSAEGNESAHVDVVNGGYDQKSFLLMAPQHEDTVRKAFEEYRRRVFPFSIREERFRDAIGPPPTVIHVVSKVNANLSFIDKLFSSTESWKQTTAQSVDSASQESDSRAESSRVSGGSVESKSTPNSSPPPQAETRSSVDKDKTSKPRMPLPHWNQFEINMGCGQRFLRRQIDARIQRQQKEFDRKDRINTERLERMERQFTRFDDLDHRFDMMEGNLMNVMEKQAGVGGTMNTLSDKISALMDMIAQTHIQTGSQATGGQTMTIATHRAVVEEDNTQHSSPSSEYSNRQLDRVSFSSPIKKKYRTGCTETETGDAGVRQQANDQYDNSGNSQIHRSSIIDTQTSEALDRDLESPALLSQAAQTPLPDDNNTALLPQATTKKLDDITTDLESRYKEKLSQGGGSAS